MTAELLAHMDNTKTDPTVSAVFLLGIHAWIDGHNIPDPTKHFPNASRDLIKAFNQQTEIGWRHVMKGRLASAWGSFINHQHNNNEPIDPTGLKSRPYINHAEKWGQGIVVIIWNHVLQIWNARNQSEHGADLEQETSRKKEKLLLEVTKIKNRLNEINYNDRDAICLTNPHARNASIIKLKTWIRHTKLLLKIIRTEESRTKLVTTLPFDRGPIPDSRKLTKPNRVSRRSVQETISTS
jgi:hypothetical protein